MSCEVEERSLDFAGRSFDYAQDRLFASRMQEKIGLLRSG
jgi:hypothetical protein